jgi:hypothetical protein
VALGELAYDHEVQWAFSGKTGEDALAVLAKLPVGVQPAEVILCAAIRGAKTLISAALALKACLTVDLSPTRPNEEVIYGITATDMGKAQAAIAHLTGTIPNATRLRPYFLRSTKSGVIVRHHSGRPIEIRVVYGGGGGRGVIARWSAGLTADEAARMQGEGGKSASLPALLRTVHARLLPGAQVFMPGSPWDPSGPIFDACQDDWGKPTWARVVIRATGPMLNPKHWTPANIEAQRAKVDGELIVQTDVWAEFGSLPTQFFTAEDIARATRPFQVDGVAQLALAYERHRTYAAFMDPATRGNAWTLVVASWLAGDTESESLAQIVLAHEWIGTRTKPLQARDVFAEMAPMLSLYKLGEVWSDQHNFDPNKEHAEACNILLLKDDAPKA